MITAVFATGRRGEFGNKNGTLPWGSIPEELELFFDTVSRLNPSALIVGAHTWLTLPNSAKERLVTENSITWVYILDPSGEAKPIVNAKPRAYSYHCVFITTVTPTLASMFKDINAVAIGGAYLLDKLYSNNLVDRALVSVIKPAAGEPDFKAEVTLPSTVYLAF